MLNQNNLRTASVLILYKNKILLLLRDDKKDVPNPNTWCLIGGFVDSDESEEEGVRREAREEAAIELQQLHRIGTHQYANGRISTTFLSVINDAQVQQLKLGNEGQEIRFFSLEELASIPLSGSIKRYFNDYRDSLMVVMKTGNPMVIERLK